MSLTVEQWEALSTEEKEARAAEKPSSSSEVKDDVVIIGGKPRPLKNFVEEITRKVKEDVMAGINTRPAEPTRQPDNTDWRKRVAQQAEKEMEETGSIVPVNTILDLINQGTNYHLNQFSTANKTAQKVIKETRKELKSSYKDYSDYEDEFDGIVENIEPQNVSKEGLKIIFQSLRGNKLDELLGKAREAGAKGAEEEKRILGDIASGNASHSSKPSGKLTAEQREEMTDMGFESEEDYSGRLKKYQDIAKRKSAKNTPQTLSERLVYS